MQQTQEQSSGRDTPGHLPQDTHPAVDTALLPGREARPGACEQIEGFGAWFPASRPVLQYAIVYAIVFLCWKARVWGELRIAAGSACLGRGWVQHPGC